MTFVSDADDELRGRARDAEQTPPVASARPRSAAQRTSPVMHLMYTLDENGNRVYTLKVSTEALFVARVKLRTV